MYIASFPGTVDVWFSLKNVTYQNNSIVTLEDIGEGDDALLCRTNQTACCRLPIGNWFFPNKTRVPSEVVNATSGEKWDFHRNRGQMVVRMHRRRGGVEGIYHCEIPDTINVIHTIYIGVYSASTGEWSILYCSMCDDSSAYMYAAYLVLSGALFQIPTPICLWVEEQNRVYLGVSFARKKYHEFCVSSAIDRIHPEFVTCSLN